MIEPFDRPAPLAPFMRIGSSNTPLGTLPLATKRRAFFSFHFDDVMRVNVVRNAWKVIRPDSPTARTFYDSSLWESRQLQGDEALKRLIRDGVTYTSAVCVLVGTDTWARRWVRYEIARAVVDGKGLLSVHINGIRHHREQIAHPRGANPLVHMAVGKVQSNALSMPTYYLFEFTQNGWMPYRDYTSPVKLPRYINDPLPGHVTPLATGTIEWDYIGHNGSANIGGWIDRAAQAVGR
jgi:hypothetical protein